MSVLIWPNPPFVSQREHKREGEASFGSTVWMEDELLVPVEPRQ